MPFVREIWLRHVKCLRARVAHLTSRCANHNASQRHRRCFTWRSQTSRKVTYCRHLWYNRTGGQAGLDRLPGQPVFYPVLNEKYASGADYSMTTAGLVCMIDSVHYSKAIINFAKNCQI